MSEQSETPVEEDRAPPAVETRPAGRRLKEAREQAGLSVVDVAQRLKYSARQIQALEDGNAEALPSLTFQRGFVRGYAKLVGLSGDELVASLENQLGADQGPTTLQLQKVSYTQPAMPAQSASNAAWPWVLAMLLAVVGIGGYALYGWEAPLAAKREIVLPRTAPASVSDPVAPVPAMTPAERPIPLPQATAEGSSSATGGKLRLIFSGDSWTEIKQSNGTIVYSAMNASGSEQWVDGQAPFDLVIGNAKDVKLFYRGAEVDLAPYIKVSVARLTLK